MTFYAQGRVLQMAAASTSLRAAFSSQQAAVPRSVFISQSDDIFANLALEDWLYKKHDFSKHRVLFLWKNKPCVVIGRHQNPWKETHVGTLAERNIALARRNSGGGTVYHDLGNLNLSFLGPRDAYNRKANLSVISSALRREFNIDSEISPRDDLILDGTLKVNFELFCLLFESLIFFILFLGFWHRFKIGTAKRIPPLHTAS